MSKKEQTLRVRIYSLPSKNGTTKVEYFADVPMHIVGDAIAFMLPYGKPVTTTSPNKPNPLTPQPEI